VNLLAALRKAMAAERREENPIWLTIFADMSTNLTLFFLLLFSMSRLDVCEQVRVTAGLENEFQSEDQKMERRMEEALARQREGTAIEELERRVLQDDLVGEASCVVQPETVRLTLNLPVLFASGSAEINPAVREILESLAASIAKFPNDVIVEGHTDDVPIKSARYPSNWELSIARAVSVIDAFTQLGLDPAHFVSAGYGEFRPVASNETPEGRARNRRIEILIRRMGC